MYATDEATHGHVHVCADMLESCLDVQPSFKKP